MVSTVFCASKKIVAKRFLLRYRAHAHDAKSAHFLTNAPYFSRCGQHVRCVA
jgi:hypothetical protein